MTTVTVPEDRDFVWSHSVPCTTCGAKAHELCITTSNGTPYGASDYFYTHAARRGLATLLEEQPEAVDIEEARKPRVAFDAAVIADVRTLIERRFAVIVTKSQSNQFLHDLYDEGYILASVTDVS